MEDICSLNSCRITVEARHRCEYIEVTMLCIERENRLSLQYHICEGKFPLGFESMKRIQKLAPIFGRRLIQNIQVVGLLGATVQSCGNAADDDVVDAGPV